LILAGFVYEFGFHTVDELRNSVMDFHVELLRGVAGETDISII
jgi:hypothetical protein